MLKQEWIDKGFLVSELKSGAGSYYQLFRRDILGLQLVAGSRNVEDMNSLAESECNRMGVLKSYQEDDGEVE